MPFFICPNCRERSIDHDRQEGLTREAVGCHRCGFGFLFELMDDYYAAPNAGMVVCDAGGRILACGRGVFELTGFQEHELMGKDVVDALTLGGFQNGQNPVALALEWGVQTRRPCQIRRCGKTPQSERGRSRARSRSILTGSSCRVKPSRCESLRTCVSTTTPCGSPSSAATTLAVFRATPGSRSSSSSRRGTRPSYSSISIRIVPRIA